MYLTKQQRLSSGYPGLAKWRKASTFSSRHANIGRAAAAKECDTLFIRAREESDQLAQGTRSDKLSWTREEGTLAEVEVDEVSEYHGLGMR